MHFSSINGMDYAFYGGENNYGMGYMRFKPLQVRGYNKAKRKMVRIFYITICMILNNI